MSQIAAPARLPLGSRQTWIAIALAVVASLGAYLVVHRIVTPAAPAPMLPPGAVRPSRPPVSPAIEATYGIQFYQAGLSGDGGLVDVRFRVLDPLRAAPVLGHHATIKMVLGNERTRSLFDTRAMTPGESNLVAGESYWVLFRNASGDIVRGDQVDIFIGSLHLDHIPVQ